MTNDTLLGALVYWNAHTGFGEIDLNDGENGRVGVYRRSFLNAGITEPQVGDRFHFSIGIAASGATIAVDLRPDPMTR